MLRECIESIFALSLNDDEREVIIVDDGSAVPFGDALRGFENKITVIRQQNQGLSAARNSGIEIARGDYIQFIDSDDRLIPEIYEHVLDYIRKHMMDMLMFRFTYDHAIYRHEPLSKCFRGIDFLVHNNLRAAACCYVFRREMLGHLRFMPGILHEDSLFTPQLIMKAESLYVLKEQAYFYRQGEGTIMSNRNESHIKKRLDDSFLILLQLQDIATGLEDTPRKAMNRCIDQQVMAYVYFLFYLRRSLNEVHIRIQSLRHHHLFPLPLRFYTLKYWIFSLLTRILH